ncbi:hypothetical protein [Candidatus Villigracilis proximus]|uniref:hypothetical protein n=1 Tax=Candidatus Villigracilis proximus TaxID=3140683 RepID=UPI0031F116B4
MPTEISRPFPIWGNSLLKLTVTLACETLVGLINAWGRECRQETVGKQACIHVHFAYF